MVFAVNVVEMIDSDVEAVGVMDLVLFLKVRVNFLYSPNVLVLMPEVELQPLIPLVLNIPTKKKTQQIK